MAERLPRRELGKLASTEVTKRSSFTTVGIDKRRGVTSEARHFITLEKGVVVDVFVLYAGSPDNNAQNLGLWTVNSPLQVNVGSYMCEENKNVVSFAPTSDYMEQQELVLKDMWKRAREVKPQERTQVKSELLWDWIEQQPDLLEKLLTSGVSPDATMYAISLKATFEEEIKTNKVFVR